jgi:hypothetical protein
VRKSAYPIRRKPGLFSGKPISKSARNRGIARFALISIEKDIDITGKVKGLFWQKVYGGAAAQLAGIVLDAMPNTAPRLREVFPTKNAA